MRANVEVRVGPLIDVSEFYGRENEPEIVQQVMLKVLKAIAVLAEQPDFEIKLAGRNWKPTLEEVASDMDDRDERLRREKSP